MILSMRNICKDYVNGKLTVRAGRLLGVDEDRLYREGKREIRRLLD